MENASKALIIAGAILLSILIIAIGIFIFNGANSTITDSMSSMSTQEIEAFNNQFTSYEGNQSGSNVKSLIGRIIANASTYSQETKKIPNIRLGTNLKGKVGTAISLSDAGSIGRPSTDVDSYIGKVSKLREFIDNKHQYEVKLEFGTSGLLDTLEIEY